MVMVQCTGESGAGEKAGTYEEGATGSSSTAPSIEISPVHGNCLVCTPWLRQAGLKDVAGVVMGANLQKPRRVTMGPWDACRLSQEQIQYACIDAFVSFEVGRKLLTGDYSSDEEENY
ncbi:hypothetical protein TRIUR3_21072 [Triticum urartu]|uniref:3'-5' exonuclease domain-containing protein n=1 Tax=Triticum urartu TaxID=4572 RepID=M7YWQ4_TRIUA|nr:hypothetical protein TRIUR3_21072 [Triticum urartu]